MAKAKDKKERRPGAHAHLTPMKFAAKLAQEAAKEGIRATARRCKMPRTSLARYIHQPATMTVQVMDNLAKQLGISLAHAKPE